MIISSQKEGGERLLQAVLDALVAAFAGWTAGYQVGFAMGLPAFVDAIIACALALAAVALLLVWARRDPWRTDDATNARLAVLLVLAAAVALAVLSTLMDRPDADDITFFHRAVTQLGALGHPILTSDTTSDVAGLPGPASGYLLTSYEYLVALVARAVGLDPLSAYQNGAGAIASALVPMVYYLLLRRLGLRPLIAVAAIAGVVAFLLLDGNDHRSMGNLAFVRLWQGKAIVLTLIAPYTLTHVLEYFESPGRRSWLSLAFAGIAATGLSAIGCFLAPACLGVAAVAVGAGLLLSRQLAWRTVLRRGLVLLLAAAYPLLLLVATVTAPFPGTVPSQEWNRLSRSALEGQSVEGLESYGWYRQLLLPPAGLFRIVWALCLVLVAPFLALPVKKATSIALFTPVFLLVVANPVAAGLLYRAVPQVYWRFYYLLPVPLCCGLLVAALVRIVTGDVTTRRRVVSLACVAVFLAAFALTISMATFSTGNVGFSWKTPTEWKLDPGTVTSLKGSLDALDGRHVLTDEPAAVALCLMDPSVRVVAQRPENTLVAFALAGREQEGRERVQAEGVAGGSTAPGDLAAFSHLIRDGADALVVRTAAEPAIAPLLSSSGVEWRRVGGDGLYTVFLRQTGP